MYPNPKGGEVVKDRQGGEIKVIFMINLVKLSFDTPLSYDFFKSF